jgi:ribokinase
VGHVEWVQFARVSHVPVAGEIIHASEVFSVPGGGGAVAAVQLRRLAGEALFVTSLGSGPEA